MPQNVEIKARVPDRDILIKNIENNTNAEWTALLDQHDTFYNAPNARLKLRRITSHDMYQLISYSREDTLGPKTSTYRVILQKCHEPFLLFINLFWTLSTGF